MCLLFLIVHCVDKCMVHLARLQTALHPLNPGWACLQDIITWLPWHCDIYTVVKNGLWPGWGLPSLGGHFKHGIDSKHRIS